MYEVDTSAWCLDASKTYRINVTSTIDALTNKRGASLLLDSVSNLFL